jgi:hypothetical protein
MGGVGLGRLGKCGISPGFLIYQHILDFFLVWVMQILCSSASIWKDLEFLS